MSKLYRVVWSRTGEPRVAAATGRETYALTGDSAREAISRELEVAEYDVMTARECLEGWKTRVQFRELRVKKLKSLSKKQGKR